MPQEPETKPERETLGWFRPSSWRLQSWGGGVNSGLHKAQQKVWVQTWCKKEGSHEGFPGAVVARMLLI